MNIQVLSRIVEELSALITGARVERVYQETNGGLCIILNRDGRKFILLLSPDRALPRMHLVTAKPPVDDSPHGFILYVRSRVSGTKVAHIALLNQDRVVELRFAGQGKEYCLVFELFGSAANLIFMDSSFKILSIYYPVPPADQVVRTLLPGVPYRAPEKKPIDKRTQKDDLIPRPGGDLSPNRTVEAYYERLIEQKRTESLRVGLLSLLKKAIGKTERLIIALSDELRSAERVDEFRERGDLVLANLTNLKTGMEQADLIGYDGKTVSVRLDPKRSPAQNAEAYFKKYKKAKAGRNIIETRLQQSEDAAAYLKVVLSRLEKSGSLNELDSIRSELVSHGYLDGGAGKRRTAPPESASLPFKKVFYREWEILIGRNAAGNDYLTTRIARPDDLWLHAEGLPGSHVLVRNPRGADIPPEVLLKAAALAAFYSKGKTSGKVSVTFTRAGLVGKPKGAKPGLVTLAERRSIMVRPEDERHG